MSEPIAINLDRVTKEYHRGSVASMGLKTALLHLPTYLRQYRQHKAFRALDQVSLQILKGESFGVIGHNGSGKSTLLSLIAGVLRPNSGKVKTHGRISPLLELGAGFHYELTGMENIILNGVLLGMTRREVASRIGDIVEFADLGEFIHEPIRTYSSGMIARLGFSVAIHLEPEILLIDEILAVGDATFQAKCYDKMKQFRSSGVTTVLVSHDHVTIERMCDRVMLLEHGHSVAVGTPAEVESVYHRNSASPEPITG